MYDRGVDAEQTKLSADASDLPRAVAAILSDPPPGMASIGPAHGSRASPAPRGFCERWRGRDAISHLVFRHQFPSAPLVYSIPTRRHTCATRACAIPVARLRATKQSERPTRDCERRFVHQYHSAHQPRRGAAGRGRPSRSGCHSGGLTVVARRVGKRRG